MLKNFFLSEKKLLNKLINAILQNAINTKLKYMKNVSF